jgi:hypothetical protein
MTKSAPTPDPLLIRPGPARRMCGNPSLAYFYGTILPQLRSFVMGRARWIEVKSLHEWIERNLAAASTSDRWMPPGPETWRRRGRRKAPQQPRRRGRPRKTTSAQREATTSMG